jgi:hypothetical protein
MKTLFLKLTLVQKSRTKHHSNLITLFSWDLPVTEKGNKVEKNQGIQICTKVEEGDKVFPMNFEKIR